MTIHHRSTRARSAPLTDGRGRVQATIDTASTPARSAAVTSPLLRGRRRRFAPAERAVDVVSRFVGLVRQRLAEPLLVVGLDALHVRDDRGLRRRILHLLDLHPELVVLGDLLLV